MYYGAHLALAICRRIYHFQSLCIAEIRSWTAWMMQSRLRLAT